MTKAKKGEYSYLSWRKKQEILKTTVLFGISAAIFVMGYFSTGSKNNLLTVVAVLGCLPASKSAVSMIMNLRVRGCSSKDAARIIEKFGQDFGIYNLYFTSYQKNYEIHHLVVKDLSVIAFSANEKTEERDFEEHMKMVLRHDGIQDYNIKLYHDLTKYINRVEKLLALGKERAEEERVISTLFSVSL